MEGVKPSFAEEGEAEEGEAAIAPAEQEDIKPKVSYTFSRPR